MRRCTQTDHETRKAKIPSLVIPMCDPLIAKNAEFQSLHRYYTQRRENPLKKVQSMVALCCKLIRIMFVLWKRKVPYDPIQMLGPIMQNGYRMPLESLIFATWFSSFLRQDRINEARSNRSKHSLRATTLAGCKADLHPSVSRFSWQMEVQLFAVIRDPVSNTRFGYIHRLLYGF